MNKNVVIQSTQGTISRTVISQALTDVGILRGDTIFLHSRLFSFGRPLGAYTKEDFANMFIEPILLLLGPEGTLIVPAFTLSFPHTGVFNSSESESEVGLLSEIFRKRDDVARSSNPIYSVAVRGKDKEHYLAASITNCTGKGSILDLIHQRGNVKILLLGLDIPDTTQFHYVEEQAHVPYRQMKTFTGIVDGKPGSIDVYVRNRQAEPIPQIDKLKFAFFFQKNVHLLKTVKLGDGMVSVIRENDLHQALWKTFAEDPNFFLKEPYVPPFASLNRKE